MCAYVFYVFCRQPELSHSFLSGSLPYHFFLKKEVYRVYALCKRNQVFVCA